MSKFSLSIFFVNTKAIINLSKFCSSKFLHAQFVKLIFVKTFHHQGLGIHRMPIGISRVCTHVTPMQFYNSTSNNIIVICNVISQVVHMAVRQTVNILVCINC